MPDDRNIDLEQEQRTIKEPHGKLLEDEFSFIPVGEYPIREVYELVQKQYSELCNNHFLCKDTCKNGHNKPEWQHRVRRVLQQYGKLKQNGKIENVKRGVWKFY